MCDCRTADADECRLHSDPADLVDSRLCKISDIWSWRCEVLKGLSDPAEPQNEPRMGVTTDVTKIND